MRTPAVASMECGEGSVNEGGSSWLTWVFFLDASLLHNGREGRVCALHLIVQSCPGKPCCRDTE